MKNILFVSEVKGNFYELSVISKNYDFVICVGETLTDDGTLGVLPLNAVDFPVPIYFIESGYMKHALCTQFKKGSELRPNFTFLGKFGRIKIQGVVILFNCCEELSDLKSNACFLSEREMESTAGKYNQVDIFVSNICSSEITFGDEVDPSEVYPLLQPNAPFVGTLIRLFKPEICIFPSKSDLKSGTFVNKEKDSGESKTVHIGSFLKQKNNYIFGLKYTPISH